MNRRSVLGRSGLVIAGLTSLAGCSIRSREDTSIRSSEERTFDLQTWVLQEAVPVLHVDYYTIQAPSRAQLLLCKISSDEREGIRLETDDETFTSETPKYGTVVDGQPVEAYGKRGLSGWIQFDLPRLKTESAVLQAESTRYRLASELVANLGDAPEFRVEDIRKNGQCVEFRVRNTGDDTGMFYAAADNGRFGTYSTTRITAGETRSASVCVDSYGNEDVRAVWWPGGAKEFQYYSTPTQTPSN